MDLFQSATGLLGAVNPVAGGLTSLGSTLTQGGDPGGIAKSEADGTFTGGGLTITQQDNTLLYAMLIGGAVLALAVLRKKK